MLLKPVFLLDSPTLFRYDVKKCSRQLKNNVEAVEELSLDDLFWFVTKIGLTRGAVFDYRTSGKGWKTPENPLIGDGKGFSYRLVGQTKRERMKIKVIVSVERSKYPNLTLEELRYFIADSLRFEEASAVEEIEGRIIFSVGIIRPI